MVRELQIEPAAVDVDRLAEERLAHRRALDVPPRPTRAPRALPDDLPRLARLSAFPQREVAWVALAAANLDPRPRLKLFRVAIAELAVIIVLRDIEPDRAARRVGVTLFDELGDHRLHSVDVLGRPRSAVDTFTRTVLDADVELIEA